MALGTPYTICGGNAAAGSIPFAVTATASTTAGDAIVVAAFCNAGTPSGWTCADSKGNTYTQATLDAGQAPKVVMFTALNTTALVSGTDTITVTFTATTGTKGLIARGCSGVATSSAVDVAIAADNVGSAAPSSGASSTLAQASEWAVAAITSTSTGGTPSAWTGGFTAVLTESNGAGQIGTLADQVVSSTASLTAAATIVSTSWAAALVTLKAAPSATPAPAAPRAPLAPGWHPGRGLPGMPGGTPFAVAPRPAWSPPAAASPFAYAGSSNLTLNGLTSGTLTLPAGVQGGDLIVLGVVCWCSGGTTITTGGAFTVLDATSGNQSTAHNFLSAYRIAAGSYGSATSDSTFTVTVGSASAWTLAFCYVIRCSVAAFSSSNVANHAEYHAAAGYVTALPDAALTVANSTDLTVYGYAGMNSTASGLETLTGPGALLNFQQANFTSDGGVVGVGWGTGLTAPGGATSTTAIDPTDFAIDVTVPGAGSSPGAATLAGAGSLTAGAVQDAGSLTALAGAGSLTAPDVTLGAGQALAGAGSLTAPDVVQGAGVTLPGAGSLTAPGAVQGAVVTLGGAGSLSTGVTLAAGVTLAGAGSLTAAGSVIVPGAATLAGAGSLTAPDVTQGAGKTLAGAGSLTAPAVVQGAGQSLAGAGALTTAGTLGAGGTLNGAGQLAAPDVTQLAGATLAGAGQLTASSGGASPGVATLSGAGSLTAPDVTQGVTALLAGAGSLTAPDVVQLAGQTLAGAGSLTAPDVIEGAGKTLAGAGSLTAPDVVQGGAATLAGAGSLAAPDVTQASGATLAGAGSLTSAVVQQVTALLAGAGSLTASSGGAAPGAAGLAGAGSLTAPDVVQGAGKTLAGAGALNTLATQQAAAILAGAGQLTAAASLTLAAGALLAGAGSLTAAGTDVLAFTVGSLTASSAADATLTAAAASSVLTASAAPQGVLTAGTQQAGGPS